MVHGPPVEMKKDNSQGYKTKLGIIMFVVYTAMYMTFVFLCVLNPQMMSIDVGSLNLAVAFGFFLIIIAVIQAVIYNIMCSKHEKAHDNDNAEGEETR